MKQRKKSIPFFSVTGYLFIASRLQVHPFCLLRNWTLIQLPSNIFSEIEDLNPLIMQLLTQEQLSSKDPENYDGKTRGPVMAPVITSQHNLGQITYPL